MRTGHQREMMTFIIQLLLMLSCGKWRWNWNLGDDWTTITLET